jgi:oxygen-independent coproporphyrinogen-3 oxidase
MRRPDRRTQADQGQVLTPAALAPPGVTGRTAGAGWLRSKAFSLRKGAFDKAGVRYAHVPWMKRHQALIPEELLPGPVARYEQLNAIHRVLTQEGG